MLDLLENYISNNWYNFHLPFPFPQKLSYLFWKGFRKKIFLVFKDNDSQPFAVLKMTNNPIVFDRLLRENETLTYLSTKGTLKGQVPVALAFFEMWGHMCLFETALEGAPIVYSIKGISTGRGLIRMKEIFSHVVNILVTLNKPGPLHDVDTKQQTVVEHGDFEPSNLLLSRTGIKILDWEYSTLQGSPFKDLLDFSLRYVHLARYLMNEVSREQPVLSDFEDTFFSTRPYARIIWESLNRYSDRIGLDKSSMRDILSIFAGKYLNERDAQTFCRNLNTVL